jgi:hypothetical protein
MRIGLFPNFCLYQFLSCSCINGNNNLSRHQGFALLSIPASSLVLFDIVLSVADGFHNVMFIVVVVGNPTCAMFVCREARNAKYSHTDRINSYTEFFLIAASYKINKMTLSFRD